MMTLDNECKTKPDITYPCTWPYKIIGRDKDKLLRCIKEVMGNKRYTCAIGNKSRTGKFITYNASCNVKDEVERNKIFKYFEDHADIEMVM